ncbi:MAG: hypothetical protein JSW06_01400 [Thermoplasmatales archaeon]|nr:MAG: hypothetical protein JSW06_01400 [Thermoplasmatales archaeon]
MKHIIPILAVLLLLSFSFVGVGFNLTEGGSNKIYGANGPLGEWPDFTPIGFITAPHPDNPGYQTHLYGDWGGIVGEEFLFLQNGKIKLLYHSYHDTYMTEHPHQEEVLHDWILGYDPITKIKYTPLAKPGGLNPGPAWEHTDTPGYIQHPITGEHLLYNTVRPGTKYLHPEWEGLPGWEGAIQVATSETSPAIGVPFEQTYENMLVAEYWWEQGWNQNGVIKGGLSEPTPVWVPHLGTQGIIRLFYRGLNGSPGSYWNWRISYADSENGKIGWVKNPVPTFDPSDPSNPAYQWTLPNPEGFSFRGAWQAHCTSDERADGVHMVMTVSNQNYAGFGHLAYYWSPDWGDTWIGHPDNPIIAPGQFPNGVPASGFQRTPTLLVDENYDRYILAYNAGHDINQKWKRRTYLATASRPANNAPDTPGIDGPTNGKVGVTYYYNFTINDIDGDPMFLWVDWDDGTQGPYTGPYESSIVTLGHTWYEKGNYTIKAMTKDVHGKLSEWGYLEVNMPTSQQTASSSWWFLQFLQNHPRMFPILRQLVGLN